MHFKITLGKSDLVSLETEEGETESDDDIVSVRTILPKFKANKSGRIALRRKIPDVESDESDLGTESVLTVVSEKQPYTGVRQPLNTTDAKKPNIEENVIDMTGGGSEEEDQMIKEKYKSEGLWPEDGKNNRSRSIKEEKQISILEGINSYSGTEQGMKPISELHRAPKRGRFGRKKRSWR